jgi:spoIIIJ-associated protein
MEGKTVEKAIQKACDELNVKHDELNYHVVSYGSSGIFGLRRSKNARISITLPSEAKIPESDCRTVSDDAPEDHGKKTDAETETIDQTHDETSVYTFAEEPVVLGKKVLTRIVDAITTDASITVKENEDRIIFYVKGGNSAVLIGKHGQTLEAIQALVEKVVKKHHTNRIWIEVDVEGYFKNRKSNLKRQAAKMAEKCRRINKPVSLGLLNAYDRRIVHLALQGNQFVRTQSHGNGFLRKLMIFPKREYHSRKQRNG